MSHTFGWLPEQANEDALHSERLLFIEEKPFHRVTRRLLAEDSLLRRTPRQLPSPPPEEDEEQEDKAVQEDAVETFDRDRFWQDVLIDFAALQSSITRIQLIHSSNERERERYVSEKYKILASSQAVRDSTIVLRAQLAEAQRILDLRKGYDGLASKILDDKKLKSREDSQSDIAALEKEIAELEAEGQETEALWAVRKEGFDKVVEDGKAYIRAIKGIKDEPDQEVEQQEEDMGEADDEAKLTSNAGTPRREGSSTPAPDSGGLTPVQTSGDDDGEIERPAQSKLREVEMANDNEDDNKDSLVEDDTQATAETAMAEDSAVLVDQSDSLEAQEEMIEAEAALESMDET